MKLFNTAVVIVVAAASVKLVYDVNACCKKADRSGNTEDLKIFGKVIGTIRKNK